MRRAVQRQAKRPSTVNRQPFKNMGKFKQLRVWQDAMDLTEGIYKITRKGEFSKDYGLGNQIQRATVSIPSNIAEEVIKATKGVTA